MSPEAPPRQIEPLNQPELQHGPETEGELLFHIGEALTVPEVESAEILAELRGTFDKLILRTDVPEQQAALNCFHDIIAWAWFGKPGDPLPKGLVMTHEYGETSLHLDSRIPYVSTDNFHRISDDINLEERPNYSQGNTRKRSWYHIDSERNADRSKTNAVRHLVHTHNQSGRERKNIQLDPVYKASSEFIEGSPVGRFINSFETPRPPVEDERRLNLAEYAMHASAIEQDLARQYSVDARLDLGGVDDSDQKSQTASMRKEDAEFLDDHYAAMDAYRKELPRRLYPLDEATTKHQSVEQQGTGIDGLRKYFLKKISEELRVSDPKIWREELSPIIDIDSGAKQGATEFSKPESSDPVIFFADGSIRYMTTFSYESMFQHIVEEICGQYDRRFFDDVYKPYIEAVFYETFSSD